eukprot:1195761-Prorocentrum_minimum.AAC.2
MAPVGRDAEQIRRTAFVGSTDEADVGPKCDHAGSESMRSQGPEVELQGVIDDANTSFTRGASLKLGNNDYALTSVSRPGGGGIVREGLVVDAGGIQVVVHVERLPCHVDKATVVEERHTAKRIAHCVKQTKGTKSTRNQCRGTCTCNESCMHPLNALTGAAVGAAVGMLLAEGYRKPDYSDEHLSDKRMLYAHHMQPLAGAASPPPS